MDSLGGRVAIITGAGRGIGREHALLFAREGAHVVVNDLGRDPNDSGADESLAQQVVHEIAVFGGVAIANYDDVPDWEGPRRLVNHSIETFGDLDTLINNAGVLRGPDPGKHVRGGVGTPSSASPYVVISAQRDPRLPTGKISQKQENRSGGRL